MPTSKRNMTSAEMQAEVLAKISQFSKDNKPLAEKMHHIIMDAAPDLHPRLWYGMPGYAKTKDSAVILFFREDKFMTFGFTEAVGISLPADTPDLLLPCAWYFAGIDSATEQKISQIVQYAVENS